MKKSHAEEGAVGCQKEGAADLPEGAVAVGAEVGAAELAVGAVGLAQARQLFRPK